jgi:fatty-acyl-CoA synthase
MSLVKGRPSTMNDDYQLNITRIIQYAATVHPKREIASRTPTGMFRYNYAKAYERICAMANALENLGIKPGDAVGVLGFNTHRFYENFFSIPGLGAAMLELNIRLAPPDLLYVAQHSDAKALFVDDFLLPLAEMLASQHEFEFFVVMSDRKEFDTKLDPVYSYEALIEENKKDREWDEIDEKSAATICYTSGTTGKPKGVYYSHRSIYLHSLAGVSNLRIGPEDCALQIVPMFHANGWGGQIGATMVGAKQVFPGFFTLQNADLLVDLIIKEGVTVTMAAPVILIPMLEYLRNVEPKPNLKGLRIASGATEPPVAMMKGFAEFGVEIIHAYGATETSPLVTMNFVKPGLELTEDEYWDLKRYQGLPVMGVEIKLVDAEGNELPWDGKSMGELWIKGPWVTKEYYNDERTKDSFVDGWWKSGDVAIITPEGYVKIVDRVKDVIKSGGEWISSVDLENTLMAHPAVYEACVIGVEHPKWQERPLALVVLRPDYKDKVTKEELIEFLKPHFAKWQLPDDVIFVDEIPKTSVGKFDKKLLREKYRDYLIKKS